MRNASDVDVFAIETLIGCKYGNLKIYAHDMTRAALTGGGSPNLVILIWLLATSMQDVEKQNLPISEAQSFYELLKCTTSRIKHQRDDLVKLPCVIEDMQEMGNL
jgi:hypothetical protein